MRVGVVDTVHVGGLEDNLGIDLFGAQGGGGVSGEVGVAGAGGEDNHAALLQVADGAAANEGLGQLPHLDGGQHPGRHLKPFQGVLQGQGVDDGGQHAHLVGGHALEAASAGGASAEDVAAADNHADADAELVNFLDFPGDVGDGFIINAEVLLAHEGFTAQLQQDALENRCWRSRHNQLPAPSSAGGAASATSEELPTL